MKLTENFTLEEFTKSDTAKRLGINNTPTQKEAFALSRLCGFVLQPLRNHYQRPVIIKSGYRCQKLNEAVGGAKNSQHTKGEAADIVVAGIPAYKVAEYLEGTADYDQLILERRNSIDFVHVSWIGLGSNRIEVLNSPQKGQFLRGIPAPEDWYKY
ncbi:MAG: D-Ala-D-Ala carboxypeptidase family metallohydrolase [Alphaproteobacteria bacterium]